MVNRYLSLTSFEQALSILKTSFLPPTTTERIPITESVNRVVAVPVFSQYPVPEANIAAMDGIAVKSPDTIGANEQTPITIEHFLRVNTGNVVPDEFDAVIMIEDTWEDGALFQIRKSVSPNQHIRPYGEDIRENQLILPKGHLIRPFDIGALATYGITNIEVNSVQIGIIPTGSELVPLGIRPSPGQVVESNTIMAQVFLSAMGARCKRYPIIRDDPDLITEGLKNALRENDMVLISAGSSAGTRDFTANVIRSLGELLFHGVTIRPGKPVMLGRIQGKPVLGLPGYPLAAQTILREFAGPLLESWGFASPQRISINAKLARTLNSDAGFEDFVPVYVGRVGTTCWGVPHVKGAGVQMATVRANGYAHVPSHVEGYEEGTEIGIVLTTDPAQINRTFLLAGNLDPVLEELAGLLREQGFFIHASGAGTIGSLLSLQKMACHAAPIGIPPYSELNAWPAFMQNMPDSGLVFVHIYTVPLGIASRSNLDTSDFEKIRWVNSKKDTVSRFLLDRIFMSSDIDPLLIKGYHHEVNGSDSVASEIARGGADAGICTAGAAAAARLNFSPVGKEQYVLAVCPDLISDPAVNSLIAVVRSPEFVQKISRYKGYNLSRIGTIHRIFKDHTVREISEEIPLQV